MCYIQIYFSNFGATFYLNEIEFHDTFNERHAEFDFLFVVSCTESKGLCLLSLKLASAAISATKTNAPHAISMQKHDINEYRPRHMLFKTVIARKKVKIFLKSVMKTVVYVKCTPLISNVGPLTLPLF